MFLKMTIFFCKLSNVSNDTESEEANSILEMHSKAVKKLIGIEIKQFEIILLSKQDITTFKNSFFLSENQLTYSIQTFLHPR